MFKTHTLNFLTFFILGLILFSACQEDIKEQPFELNLDNFKSDIVVDYYELFLDLERHTPGYRPPISARTLGYIGLAGYEAVVPFVNKEQISVVSQISDVQIPEIDNPLEYNWNWVLAATYERIFNLFFETAPTEQQYNMILLAQKIEEKLKFDASLTVKQYSKDFGYQVAEIIYEWSKTDEIGHSAFERNLDPNYNPPTGPGMWQPTYPDFSQALTPYWGEVRTFVSSSDDKAKDPLPYSEDVQSQLYAQALETQVITNEIKNGQRYEDLWIADFWSDDCPILTFTPAGRWIAIANQSVEQSNLNMTESLQLYAKLGIALSDAGVRCWGEKFRFNYLRPIDYIRKVMKDENWNTVMCPDGSGKFYTPNFPSYPSGHATFGGAASIILADVMGENYSMTDRCHEGRTEFIGTPRTFASFHEMAEENSYSRIPMGVHFRMDSEAGIDLGRRIGRKVIHDINWIK